MLKIRSETFKNEKQQGPAPRSVVSKIHAAVSTSCSYSVNMEEFTCYELREDFQHIQEFDGAGVGASSVGSRS
jgi:hypothetical protein